MNPNIKDTNFTCGCCGKEQPDSVRISMIVMNPGTDSRCYESIGVAAYPLCGRCYDSIARMVNVFLDGEAETQRDFDAYLESVNTYDESAEDVRNRRIVGHCDHCGKPLTEDDANVIQTIPSPEAACSDQGAFYLCSHCYDKVFRVMDALVAGEEISRQDLNF